MKTLICLLLALPVMGQSTVPQVMPLMREYLQLTVAQGLVIQANAAEYNRFYQEKALRMQQVYSELAEETAKESSSTAELGVRYQEIEWICRELNEKAAQLQKQNQEQLTAEQKKKLGVLEEALALVPLMAEAKAGNVLGGVSVAPTAFSATFANSPAWALLFPTGVNGCVGVGLLIKR